MFPIGLALVIIAACFAFAFIVKVIADGVVRYNDRQGEQLDRATQDRLARIESSVEAIAIETERIGELVRFSAQLQSERAPAGELSPPARRIGNPDPSGRSVTPH
ncbi:MAG: hypothetical protein O2973_12150 [Gemmatimonadetes bacterium]|nr:hypothetical protein [Gemmatimonadota bacterium]